VELEIDKKPKLDEKQPKMWVIQLHIGGHEDICTNAVKDVNDYLGSFAAHETPYIVMAGIVVIGKSEFRNRDRVMKKDAAETLFRTATEVGESARMHCGCGKRFRIRMEEDS